MYEQPMITGRQLRMARAALRWKAKDLAERSGVSWNTIQRIESGDNFPNSTFVNLQAIKQTLEDEGIEFMGDTGVRLNPKK